MFKHNKAVYYNSENNGIHVVHGIIGDKAIVSDCSTYYSDAYTGISRYEIPLWKLNTWIRVYKRKIDSYPFLKNDHDTKAVVGIPERRDFTSEPYVRKLPSVKYDNWRNDEVAGYS